MGLLRPVYQGTGAAHYVLLLDGHHHHLVCSRCRRVIEFDECALAIGQLVQSLVELVSYEVLPVSYTHLDVYKRQDREFS